MAYPIILAHGVCRFDIVWKVLLGVELDNCHNPCLDQLHYFRGLQTALAEKGYCVRHSCVSWAGSLERRACDLRNNVMSVLAETGAEKVNIIAHSMGGLDAREMMFNDRNDGKIHRRIASLTTISTPHQGSPFIDWTLMNFPHVVSFAEAAGLNLEAFKNMRVSERKKFNEDPEVIEFEDECAESSIFETYAGRQDFWRVPAAFTIPSQIIQFEEGDNDGLVSVQSAKWKERFFRGVLERTDHLNQLGWWGLGQVLDAETPGDLLKRIHRFYMDIASRLP